MRRGAFWPIAMVGLLGVSVAANVAFIVIASRDPSFAVERDYYRKALAWDAEMEQARRNADLAWRVELAFAERAGRDAVARLSASPREPEPAPRRGVQSVMPAAQSAHVGDASSALPGERRSDAARPPDSAFLAGNHSAAPRRDESVSAAASRSGGTRRGEAAVLAANRPDATRQGEAAVLAANRSDATRRRQSALPDASQSPLLEATVSDRDGRRIAGAHVTVEAIHNARASDVVVLALEPVGDGRYVASLAAPRAGLWELRVRVEHGGHVFTNVQTRELGRTS